MPQLSFVKMHGLGNDYVYVDCFEQTVPDPAGLARRVSPRRTSIGSDGLILIRRSTIADCRMEMYNADGSRGEMCGNGIRCVGKFAFEQGYTREPHLTVETDAGVKTLDLEIVEGLVRQVAVDMGEPELLGPAIPVAAPGRVIDAPLLVDGNREFRITCVSMGNPHCVIFVSDAEAVPIEEIGPKIEHHPFFPRRVNTEFIQLIDRSTIRMRVWERGSGETEACGTGACAAVVAASLNHHTDRNVTVRLNGGDLTVHWRETDNHVLMTGPAEEVFRGHLTI